MTSELYVHVSTNVEVNSMYSYHHRCNNIRNFFSNEQYVKTLYQNILDREPDADGYNYWVGQLNNGIEDRSELLLGFAESTENKNLFSEVTGVF